MRAVIFILILVIVVILGAAMAYGIVHVRHMSARKRRQSEQATRELYDHLR